MTKKIIHFLILSLVILLALVNSHFFDLLWIKWWFYVNWNYEFTKTIFFNIFSGLIILLFYISNFWKKIKFSNLIYIPIFLLIITSIFSKFPLTNIFWEAWKWHWLLMFINLIWLFIVLINQEKKFLVKTIKTFIYSSIFILFFWFKEYFFPTFDYWNLSNRAISTLWHPNFLALYLIVLIPFLINEIKNNIYKIILFLSLILLFLTKSIVWISLLIAYLIFIWKNKINKKYFYLLIFSLISIWIFIIYKFWFITKLNSFISRFYIWETSFKIIFSDIKILLFWAWADSLSYIFNTYKSAELYIFENIWFTADRNHNIFIYIFYHFWIFNLIWFLYLLLFLFKNYKNNPYYNSIILFILFCFLNFSSIVTYFFIIILLSYIFKNKIKTYNKIYSIFIMSLISLFWVVWSFIYYIEEYKSKLTATTYIQNKYYLELKSEKPKNKIIDNSKLNNLCETLTKEIPTAENYFYCWNLYWSNDKEKSIIYYKKWLEIIPDMRNNNSKYYDSFLIKLLFSRERFFSEKYSNLKEILNRVNSENIE